VLVKFVALAGKKLEDTEYNPEQPWKVLVKFVALTQELNKVFAIVLNAVHPKKVLAKVVALKQLTKVFA